MTKARSKTPEASDSGSQARNFLVNEAKEVSRAVYSRIWLAIRHSCYLSLGFLTMCASLRGSLIQSWLLPLSSAFDVYKPS
jgi:hypothetical protein